MVSLGLIDPLSRPNPQRCLARPYAIPRCQWGSFDIVFTLSGIYGPARH